MQNLKKNTKKYSFNLIKNRIILIPENHQKNNRELDVKIL